MGGLEVRDGVLAPNNSRLKEGIKFTSKGKSHINETEYDAFLLYGLDFKVSPYFGPGFYSSHLKNVVRKERFELSLMGYIFGCVRSLSSKRVFVGHNPLPARPREYLDEVFSAEEFEKEVRWLDGYLGEGSELIGQPVSTIDTGSSTKESFGRNSVKLETGDDEDNMPHEVNDIYHMGFEFGEQWLFKLFENLK